MITWLKNIYHYLFAFCSAIFFGAPSKDIFVIGITGTKGKSTSVAFISTVLEAAGYKTAYLSSVEIKIGDVVSKNTTGNTMPGRFAIQKFFHDAVRAGCEYAILEVTSQGIVQHRHRFIDYDIVAMTGLHPEHIESHGSFEAYRDVKLSFFALARKQNYPPLFLINNESSYRHAFEGAAKSLSKKREPEIIFYRREDVEKEFLKENGEYKNEMLASNFNLENASLAYAAARSQGVPHETIIDALSGFTGLAGRMEFVTKSGMPDVLIDYAHTPGSFEAVFQYLRNKRKPKRLLCVFGSYGEGRDKWKRPRLGELASQYCDEIILTNEGPGDEDPQEIVDQIARGIVKKGMHRIILDREEAIRYAIDMGRAGDIVALLGKGHETYIRIGKETIPWNEKALVERIFAE